MPSEPSKVLARWHDVGYEIAYDGITRGFVVLRHTREAVAACDSHHAAEKLVEAYRTSAPERL